MKAKKREHSVVCMPIQAKKLLQAKVLKVVDAAAKKGIKINKGDAWIEVAKNAR